MNDRFEMVAYALALCVIALVTIWFASAQCSSKATLMQVEHSYGPLQGCMVKVNGRWLPLQAVREVNP
jgi:hypothetical protein